MAQEWGQQTAAQPMGRARVLRGGLDQAHTTSWPITGSLGVSCFVELL